MTGTVRVPEVSPSPSFRRSTALLALAVTVGALAYWRSPERASALGQFFPSAAQISATLLVAVALFAGALADPVAVRVRSWIDPWTFVYLGVAIAASMIASITSLPIQAHRWLFALTCGAGASSLLTVLLIGYTNLTGQQQRAAAARADQLDHDASHKP